ncbi:MAG: hypothetical protein M1281_06010, partial [Chloroflexi bacterium]|nr:hypothetical protein [Chloroflexota bacterium]
QAFTAPGGSQRHTSFWKSHPQQRAKPSPRRAARSDTLLFKETNQSNGPSLHRAGRLAATHFFFEKPSTTTD